MNMGSLMYSLVPRNDAISKFVKASEKLEWCWVS